MEVPMDYGNTKVNFIMMTTQMEFLNKKILITN